MFSPAEASVNDILGYSPDASRLHWLKKARFYHLMWKAKPSDYMKNLRDAFFEACYQHDTERERTLKEMKLYNDFYRDYNDLIAFYEGKLNPTGVTP